MRLGIPYSWLLGCWYLSLRQMFRYGLAHISQSSVQCGAHLTDGNRAVNLLPVDEKSRGCVDAEAAAFLGNAFTLAILLMVIILVTQFNSFYQTGLILSAALFSTAAVMLGLMILREPFGIVMSGRNLSSPKGF